MTQTLTRTQSCGSYCCHTAPAGYGLYWYILELIAKEVNEHNLTFELEDDSELISMGFGMPREQVESAMRTMVELNLFEASQGRITCLKLLKRIDASMLPKGEMRAKLQELKELEPWSNHGQAMAQSWLNHVNQPTNQPTNNKGPDAPAISKRFTPPTVDEVQEYISAKGYRFVCPRGVLQLLPIKGLEGGQVSHEGLASVCRWMGVTREEKTKRADSREATLPMNRVQEIDFTNIKVHEILAKAEATKVGWLDSHSDRILERAANPREWDGWTTPWSKLEDKVRIRKGEFSIVGAYNGDGKTTWTSQLALHIAQQTKVGIISLEMELDDIGVMMGQQSATSDNPPLDWYRDFLAWSDGRIAVYDRLDMIKPEESLACLYHMIVHLGCEFLVLDSLMMVGVTEDTEKERKFAATLAGMTKKYGVHIMLVHHMRKPQKGYPMPNKFDLLGSSHLSNMAMAIYVWWEDREKTEARNFGEAEPTKPDFVLGVEKQRFGRYKGNCGFWIAPGRSFSSRMNNECRHLEIPRLRATA